MREIKTAFFGLYWTLGDLVSASTIVHAIKLKYPNAKITLCTANEYGDIYESNPDVSEVIRTTHPFEVILRAGEKDYDIVCLPLMTSNEDSLWHQRFPWCVDNGDKHNLIDFYADRCGLDLELTDRRHHIYPQDKHWNEIVEKIEPKDREYFTNTPYITVHTTTRNESKDWPYNNWVELTRRIKQEYGNKLEIYQIGLNDKQLPSPVIPVMNLAILNTAALIKKAKLSIDVDSGTSFISDALNVPTVVIMGATSPNCAGPTGGNVTFIEPPVRECIGSATHCVCLTKCLINKPCINLVTVDEVFNAVKEKLDDALLAKV